MADIVKVGTPSISTITPCAAHQIAGLIAGEALAAGDACYIKSDGKAWKSIGTAVNAAAKVDGYAARDCPVGESVTLINDVTWEYGSGLTPGARVFLSATAGGGKLSDVATVGGTGPIGFVVDATRIRLLASAY